MINFTKSIETRSILEYFGVDHQKEKLVEEMNELELALAEGTEEEIYDEFADVFMVWIQLYNQSREFRDKVNERLDFKVKRTLKRIEENYYAKI